MLMGAGMLALSVGRSLLESAHDQAAPGEDQAADELAPLRARDAEDQDHAAGPDVA